MARRSWGTVRKLPSGRWQARYRDKSGRQRAVPGTFPSKADAGRALARLQADMDRGDYFDPKAGRVTLEAYAESWVLTRMVRGGPLAPRTAELYRSQLALHIVPQLGGTELRHLDAKAIKAWHRDLTGSSGPGMTTAAKCYRLLRAILNTATEEDLIPRNPCSIRGAGRENVPERPMLSVDQVDALADAVPDRWRAAVLLAAWAGLRSSEVAALRRHRLDLVAGTVTVAEPVKSEASKRTVAIPPHVLEELQHHLEHYAQPQPDGLVFVGPLGGPLRRSNFNEDVFRPAVKAAGLPPGITFHDLRGVSATLAARAGGTTKELMRRLGHSSPAMALRYQRAEAERDTMLARAMSSARGTGEARSPTEPRRESA